MTNSQLFGVWFMIFSVGWLTVTAIQDHGWGGRVAKFLLWLGLVGFAAALWFVH